MIPSTCLFFVEDSPEVSIDDRSINGIVRAGYQLSTDGSAYQKINSTYSAVEGWLDRGFLSDFEVYVSRSGDSLSSGTTNTWLPMTSSYLWEIVSPPGFVKNTILSVSIRDADTEDVLDTATITLEADNT